MDPVLDELHAEAALRSGWPSLAVSAATEERADELRDLVVSVVGAVPQAWLVEPDRDGDLLELRVDLPDLTPLTWRRLRERLRLEGAEARLVCAEAPAVVEALERGWLELEVVNGGGLAATWLRDPDATRRPDLLHPPASDPWRTALGHALSSAVRAVRPELAPRSELGPDTVSAVVHRGTGRAGVELWIPADGGDPLPDRAAVLTAIAPVLVSVGLCPDLEWEAPLGGLLFRAWLAVPPGPGLPGDEVVAVRAPDPGWAADLVDLAHHAELQVVPRRPEDHERVVAALQDLPGADELGGGAPRWLLTERGRVFCPVWRSDAVPDPALLEAVRAAPGVDRVRVVPGAPWGLEDRWPAIAPAWRTARGVTFCRWTDVVLDRDRLERVADRVPEARDFAVGDRTDLELRPIVDTRGRRGLEAVGGPSSLGEVGLAALLGAVAALPDPDLSALGVFGFGRDGARVRRWWRRPRPDPSKNGVFSTSYPGS